MNIGYIAWLGAGFLGVYILNRNPGKLVFGRNFQGSMRLYWGLLSHFRERE